MLKRAAEVDANRQKQITNQKEAIDRLLDRTNRLQAKIDEAIDIANVAIAEGNASEVVHHMATVLSATIDE